MSSPNGQYTIIPGFFRLVLAENAGAAFGIAHGQRIFLAIIAAVAVGVILWAFYTGKARNWLVRIAFPLFLAGIVGNLHDRLFNDGLVRDFKLTGKRVEVLRSDHGNPVLISGLEQGGAMVREVIVYDIMPLSGEAQAAFVREALAGGIDAYTFTSTMTARSLLMMGESMGKQDELKKAINAKKVAVIGHPTAAFLKENGIRVDVVPVRFTFEDMIDALLPVLG
jgi:hypothetical protein